MEMNRRAFLGASAAASASVLAVEDKVFDGGLAEVTKPGTPKRAHLLVPAGAGSEESFSRKCIGCQLCVAACPHHVLRPSIALRRCSLPEMGFETGWCRPSCTSCGAVCPAGAIRQIKPEEKRNTHIGRATWHKDRCLAAAEGVSCNSCQRHCPANAIVLMPLDRNDPASPKIPVVDEAACIGCGACEHFCPARPLPAMTLEGYAVHRVVRPMGEADVLAEAKSLLANGGYSFVLIRDGIFIGSAKGRGVASLLDLFDYAPDKLKGAWIVMKTAGRAAAALAVCGGIVKVNALMASEGAAEVLKKGDIPLAADKSVPVILNESKSAPCPIEDAVKGIAKPKDIVRAARERIAQLRADATKAS